MKTLRRKMHGPAVKRLQEFGDLIGLDYGPNDGIFGPQTEQMVKEIQRLNRLEIDGICGPLTWESLLILVDKVTSCDPDALKTGAVVDIRGRHARPKLWGGTRPPSRIDTIVLHQTGCDMPDDPRAWRRLNAHIGVLRSGVIVLVNPVTDMIWHAQGLSRNSIGVEIEGNFPGVEGKMNTLWKGGGGPDTLSIGQLNAVSLLGDLIESEIGEISHVMAHRQSSSTRPADPGSEIWRDFGIVLQSRFGATDGGNNFRTGLGRPIPREWDSRRTSRYWD